MTEVIDAIQMKIGYDKFIALRLRQKETNLKYRLTEHGKAKTNEMHRNWVAKIFFRIYRIHKHKSTRKIPYS